MPILVALTIGLVWWVSAWSLGIKSFDAFMLTIAMVLVAVGHWLVVVPRYENGRFDGVNALETVPLMGQLTWLFQVMPLFFAVGGFAGAASWRSARTVPA